jgi:DNA-binding transcriptional LysR family regulator
MPFDIRHAAALEHIDRRGTISAAADALNFTTSGLSRQVRVLEGELGVELVERTPRAAQLTPAGRVLMSHVSYIQERLRRAEDDVRAIAQLQAGRLRIATFRSVAETLVADAVAYFAGHWPGVAITLREGEPEEYLPLLLEGEADLALTFTYDGVSARELDQPVARVHLRRDEMLVVLPAGHRLAATTEIDLADLRGEAWIVSTPRSSVQAFTRQACLAAGYEPRIALSTDDYHVARALVANGVGATFLPALATKALGDACVARPVAGAALHRDIYAAYRVGGERAPAVAQMLQVLKEVAADA